MHSPLSVLGAEARLLLGAVPVGLELAPDNDPPARPAESGDLDWRVLYRLLQRERAAAALHPLAARLGLDPPSGWDDRFRALGAVSGFHQRRLLHRLEEVVGRLHDRGISVCLLKGAALALTEYREPLQRSMADLDLLVEPGRLSEAWQVLRETGWQWDRDSYPADLYDARQHLPPLEDPDRRGQFVELHHALFIEGHPFRFGADDLRSGARTVAVGGADALVPAPATHLVYTCIHFAWSHTMAKAGWRTFRDVAVLAGAPGFGWDDFLAAARRSGAERPCYWTLRMSRRLGGVEVPERALKSLTPSRLPPPLLRALERHFALRLVALGRGEGRCPSVALSRILWRVGARPSGRGALPWAQDEGFHGLEGDGPDEGVPGPLGRVGRHLGDAGTWARYLGAVLVGRHPRDAAPSG